MRTFFEPQSGRIACSHLRFRHPKSPAGLEVLPKSLDFRGIDSTDGEGLPSYCFVTLQQFESVNANDSILIRQVGNLQAAGFIAGLVIK